MIKSNWWELAPLVLNYKGKVNSTRDLSQKISNFYFGEGGPASSTLARLSDVSSPGWLNLFTIFFGYP